MMYMYVLWSDQKLEVGKAWESLLHRSLSRDLDQDSCSPPLIISQVAYTFLMYVEFGIGDWLEPRPFLYGVVHQVRGVSVQWVCSLVPRPSSPPASECSVFANCKRSKAGGSEGFGSEASVCVYVWWVDSQVKPTDPKNFDASIEPMTSDLT